MADEAEAVSRFDCQWQAATVREAGIHIAGLLLFCCLAVLNRRYNRRYSRLKGTSSQ